MENKRIQILVVVCICLIAAFLMRSELVYVPDLNDNVLHLMLVKGMVQAVERGHNPFDFWSPEVGLGQPIVKLYEPLAHAIVVAVYYATFKLIPLLTVFLWVKFLAVVLLPITFYYTARLLDMPNSAVYAAGICLLMSGDMFGIELGSYTWGGHGLFPQAVATHLLLLAIGFGWRAFQHGGSWIVPALLLGATGWANLLYGYCGAVTMVIIAACAKGDK